MPTYKRKQLGSIAALDKEQARVKKMYQDIEKNWTSAIFNPQAIAVNTLSSLLTKKNKSKKGGKTNALLSSKTQNKNGNAVTDILSSLAKNKTVKNVAAATGRSWLRWQAFNLAFFLGKKGYQVIKQNLHKRKIKRQILKAEKVLKKK